MKQNNPFGAKQPQHSQYHYKHEWMQLQNLQYYIVHGLRFVDMLFPEDKATLLCSLYNTPKY